MVSKRLCSLRAACVVCPSRQHFNHLDWGFGVMFVGVIPIGHKNWVLRVGVGVGGDRPPCFSFQVVILVWGALGVPCVCVVRGMQLFPAVGDLLWYSR